MASPSRKTAAGSRASDRAAPGCHQSGSPGVRDCTAARGCRRVRDFHRTAEPPVIVICSRAHRPPSGRRPSALRRPGLVRPGICPCWHRPPSVDRTVLTESWILRSRPLASNRRITQADRPGRDFQRSAGLSVGILPRFRAWLQPAHPGPSTTPLPGSLQPEN